VAEEIEGQDTGAEAVAGAVDPVALAFALGGASREDAHEFLKKQGALIDDQRHHLHEQLKQLHIGIWEKWLGVLLRLAAACVGIVVAAGLGLMVWDAAHSRGLLIEPFSVPPDMASRGLTGEVVAAQLLDRLAIMGSSESSRSTQSYANNWGNDIKVEIPETGVSISELERFLRGWLGHDTRISGEVYHTAMGIAVTTRASTNGVTFTGAENDLDALIQKSAEHVFEITQPYRYANYLDRNYNPVGLADRVARAATIYGKLIAGSDPFERAWAWNGLGTIAFRFHDDDREATADYRKAVASAPDFTIGWFALASREFNLDREEDQLAEFREASRLLHRDSIPDLNPNYIPNARLSAEGAVGVLTGDFGQGVASYKAGAELPDSFSVLARGNFQYHALVALAAQHDLGGMRSYLRELGIDRLADPISRTKIAAAQEDWRAVTVVEADAQKGGRAFNGLAAGQGVYNYLRPEFALARAHLGDVARAEALIAPTAADCDGCLRTHARIAELRGQQARADWWFARAVTNAPSVPFAYADWGQALLKRGKPNEAIAQFTLANQKGPHFADPLEGWGEALMAKNQSHLALAKFAEAEKYAPNWGRLHLKWGEALVWAGKKDEAKAQFAHAAVLDLTPVEKSELKYMNPIAENRS
jgi:tetratricopeptide (TPR) repeat protein